MNLERILPYLWKTPIFGATLFLGVITGDFLAGRLGLEAPASLSSFPPAILAIYLLVISPLLLGSLLFICYLITGGFLVHWLTLSLMTWAVYSLGTVLSGAPRTTPSGISSYLVVVFFFASFLGAGVAVLLFPSHYKQQGRFLIGRESR